MRDRVILAADIPAAQHRLLIGRGGQHLIDLQNKRNVQIQFPGSRSYNQVGEPENAIDLADVDAANVVKVSGSRTACKAAIEELKVNLSLNLFAWILKDADDESFRATSDPLQRNRLRPLFRSL